MPALPSRRTGKHRLVRARPAAGFVIFAAFARVLIAPAHVPLSSAAHEPARAGHGPLAQARLHGAGSRALRPIPFKVFSRRPA